MDAPRMEVKCNVDNCHYNKDRMCYANSLEINPMGYKKAESSDSTCCTTFKRHE